MQLYETPETPDKVKKTENKIQFITVLVLLIAVLISSTFTYLLRSKVIKMEADVETLINDNIALNKKLETIEQGISGQELSEETETIQQREFTGTIEKEEIPEEYALGDYWYVLYFNEPQLIETVAGDEELESIQVESEAIEFDEYLQKDVKVTGRMSTGFIETPVVLVSQVEEL